LALAYIRWSNIFVCLRLPSRETWHFSASFLSSPSVPSPSSFQPPLHPHPTLPNACRQSPPWDETTCFTNPNCPRANQRKFCSTRTLHLFIYFRKSHGSVCVCHHDVDAFWVFCGPPRHRSHLSLQHAAKCLMLLALLFSKIQRHAWTHTVLYTGNSETSPMLHSLSLLACPQSLSIKRLPNAFPRCLVATAPRSTISRL
jgi:hypothetical protein